MGKQWKQCKTLYYGVPKSLQMVIAAMKLKDTYSLNKAMVKFYMENASPKDSLDLSGLNVDTLFAHLFPMK